MIQQKWTTLENTRTTLFLILGLTLGRAIGDWVWAVAFDSLTSRIEADCLLLVASTSFVGLAFTEITWWKKLVWLVGFVVFFGLGISNLAEHLTIIR